MGNHLGPVTESERGHSINPVGNQQTQLVQLQKRLLRSYPRDTKAILEVVTASVLVIVLDNNNPCGFFGIHFYIPYPREGVWVTILNIIDKSDKKLSRIYVHLSDTS